jgi:hypothetical protein
MGGKGPNILRLVGLVLDAQVHRGVKMVFSKLNGKMKDKTGCGNQRDESKTQPA